jgi:excinuclease UvrABC nuclease subunit
LVKTFGSVDRLAQATAEEIASASGIPSSIAEALLARLSATE